MQDTFNVFAPFGGIGGGALGFQQATESWRDIDGNFELLGGLDSDPLACQDFLTLTGVPEAQAQIWHVDYLNVKGEWTMYSLHVSYADAAFCYSAGLFLDRRDPGIYGLRVVAPDGEVKAAASMLRRVAAMQAKRA